MKKTKFSILLLLIICISFFPFCSSKEKTDLSTQEDGLIPPEAHEKAIQALELLGPERGARYLDSRVIDIEGKILGLVIKSEDIQYP